MSKYWKHFSKRPAETLTSNHSYRGAIPGGNDTKAYKGNTDSVRASRVEVSRCVTANHVIP